MVDSPCIGVCEATDDMTCAGCHRTLSEIAAWHRLTDAEKTRVLAAARERKAAKKSVGPRAPDG